MNFGNISGNIPWEYFLENKVLEIHICTHTLLFLQKQSILRQMAILFFNLKKYIFNEIGNRVLNVAIVYSFSRKSASQNKKTRWEKGSHLSKPFLINMSYPFKIIKKNMNIKEGYVIIGNEFIVRITFNIILFFSFTLFI